MEFWRKKPNILKFIFLLILPLLLVYLADKFFDRYDLKFAFPIVLRSPIRIEKREIKVIEKKILITPAPAKTKSEAEIIKEKKHAKILWAIYGLESSWGRNDGCRKLGKYNGFGYGQNKFSWSCFSSFEEVVEKVNEWFEDKFKKGYDLKTALCFYNTGLVKNDCQYYRLFLSLR